VNEDPELEAIRQKKMMQLHRFLEREAERSLWPSSPIHVSDLDFNETISKYPLVLVDFWASWCMPCKMIASTLDQLSSEYKGKVVFAKLDVDQNKRTTEAYKVSGIPTLIMFKNGRPAERVTGALPRHALKGLIERHSE